MIRQAIKDETPLGKEAKAFVAAGKLVTDELVINLVLEEIKAIQQQKANFLLDGFPRNLAQARALDQALANSGSNLDLAILITIDSTKLIERITGRRICTNKECGALYHIHFAPSKQEMICDRCGSALYQRDDDKEDLVQSRMNTYLSETSPLIEYYSNKNKLIQVDGNQESLAVSLEIESKVLALV